MKNNSKNKKNIFFILLILALLFLIVHGTFIDLMHNSFTIRRLSKKSAALDKQYEQLSKEYEEILSGKKDYIEDNARVKYNMAKPGEIEFRIKK